MIGLDIERRRTELGSDRAAGVFRLRRLDLARDLPLVHSWMNDPEVARFWEMPWSRDRIADYLRSKQADRFVAPCLGELDGVAMSYWECYRADLDPLAEYYPARDHDAGVHLLLGPSAYRGRGLAADLLDAVAGWQLDADPLACRVVAEPDVRNQRSVRTFQRAGFRRVADVDLPDKRAALMVRDREPR